MKALQHKVNIIPIIAKADALTSEELIQMKQIVGINLKKKLILNEFMFRFLNKFKIIKFISIKYLIVILMTMKNGKRKIMN
jgi:hypothetical protein